MKRLTACLLLTLVTAAANAGEKPKRLEFPDIKDDGTFTIRTSGKPIEGRLEGDCRFWNDPGPPRFLEFKDGTITIDFLRTYNGDGFWIKEADTVQIEARYCHDLKNEKEPAVVRKDNNGVKIMPPSDSKGRVYFTVKIKPRDK